LYAFGSLDGVRDESSRWHCSYSSERSHRIPSNDGGSGPVKK